MKTDVKEGSVQVTYLTNGFKIVRWIDGTGALRSKKVPR